VESLLRKLIMGQLGGLINSPFLSYIYLNLCFRVLRCFCLCNKLLTTRFLKIIFTYSVLKNIIRVNQKMCVFCSNHMTFVTKLTVTVKSKKNVPVTT